ncbi:MAG: hypothetical protein FJW20_16130 [Acidimicrobiia bacterium]|nr:hypothetical protein [Acidimicrobiia bacterium]
MLLQLRAILWAQWRTLRNFYPRGHYTSLVFTVVMSALWYGMVATGATGVGILFSSPGRLAIVERVLTGGLLLAFLYWQIVPIVLVSTGASLDLKRLIVYPISHSRLFGLEVLLRFSTGVEMLIVLTGATIGLLLNPAIPWWSCLGFVPFIATNLFLSVALRQILSRWLGKRRIRELAIFGLVLVAALPQLYFLAGLPDWARQLINRFHFPWWPWTMAAQVVLGRPDLLVIGVLAGWTAAAFLFGRWQFERGFKFDAEAERATVTKPLKPAGLLERLYRLPAMLLPDPLGAIVEKEIRFLSRAPRFRLVFMMGFSFGLLIWLPIAYRSGSDSSSAFASNYLTFVTLYALLLLGEVSFWNTFGFDRSASQLYYLVPVPMAAVLVAKNIAAAIFVFLEISAVAVACTLLRMPISASKLVESYAVSLVMTVFLIAIGNLSSTHFPRPVNPAHSWRSASAGRFQAMLLMIYPIMSIPIVLAYLARYAFDSQLAFYGVLGFSLTLGSLIYWVAMESSVSACVQRKEKLLATLSQGDGPVSA